MKGCPLVGGVHRSYSFKIRPGHDSSLFPNMERLPNAALQRGEIYMAGNGIVEVTDANFDADVLKSDKPVLVDFWATWCGPCRAIAPIVEELALDYQGKVKIGKMDVDANSSTPMRYKVTGIPTLLVFKGGQVVEQIVGYRPKEAIAQALDRHVS
jgi:thioredoxin 1